MQLIKTSFFSGIITIIRIASGFVANKVVAVYTGPSGVAVIGAFTNFIASSWLSKLFKIWQCLCGRIMPKQKYDVG